MIIANAGVNFAKRGSLPNINRATLLIEEAAVLCGATHISFDLFDGESLYADVTMQGNMNEIALPTKWLEELSRTCQDFGIELLFDTGGIKFLQMADAYTSWTRVAGGEITHIPFLNAAARTEKPVLLSTAGATVSEIETALELLRPGNEFPEDVVLLGGHIMTPTARDRFDMRQVLDTVGAFTFDLGTYKMIHYGFSSKCPDPILSAAPAILGAEVIEAGLDLMDGKGHGNAGCLSPTQFKEMVELTKHFNSAMTRVELTRNEKNYIASVRRSEEDWLRPSRRRSS